GLSFSRLEANAEKTPRQWKGASGSERTSLDVSSCRVGFPITASSLAGTVLALIRLRLFAPFFYESQCQWRGRVHRESKIFPALFSSGFGPDPAAGPFCCEKTDKHLPNIYLWRVGCHGRSGTGIWL